MARGLPLQKPVARLWGGVAEVGWWIRGGRGRVGVGWLSVG